MKKILVYILLTLSLFLSVSGVFAEGERIYRPRIEFYLINKNGSSTTAGGTKIGVVDSNGQLAGMGEVGFDGYLDLNLKNKEIPGSKMTLVLLTSNSKIQIEYDFEQDNLAKLDYGPNNIVYGYAKLKIKLSQDDDKNWQFQEIVSDIISNESISNNGEEEIDIANKLDTQIAGKVTEDALPGVVKLIDQNEKEVSQSIELNNGSGTFLLEIDDRKMRIGEVYSLVFVPKNKSYQEVGVTEVYSSFNSFKNKIDGQTFGKKMKPTTELKTDVPYVKITIAVLLVVGLFYLLDKKYWGGIRYLRGSKEESPKLI